jgi:hypothetical protein
VIATTFAPGRLAGVPSAVAVAARSSPLPPWLLRQIDLLSDLLGMDLVLEEAEHRWEGSVPDLKSYDESTGEVVIVENELETLDHTHLGPDHRLRRWYLGLRPRHRSQAPEPRCGSLTLGTKGNQIRASVAPTTGLSGRRIRKAIHRIAYGNRSKGRGHSASFVGSLG